MTSREWAEKDYYADLGVSSSATAQEIKKAYRKIARENHPDTKPGDKVAEERFKKAAEAYDVIGDETKRKEYDELKTMLKNGGGFRGFGAGQGGSGFPGGFRSATENINLNDLFGQSGAGFGAEGFAGDFLGGLFNGGGHSRRSAAPARGANVETEVTIDFAEAVLGSTITLDLRKKERCQDCQGSGSKNGKTSVCPDCHGQGVIRNDAGHFGMASPCPKCQGTGTYIPDPCPHCRGTGTQMRTKTVTVRVPEGFAGKRLRVPGEGEAGPNGKPAGDLMVRVHVRPDPVFTRDGNNLHVTVPVSFDELALGATITVPTLGKPVRMKIAPGTPNGRTLRVKGRGVPNKRNTDGDLMVTLDVQVPTNLSVEASNLLRQYAQAANSSGADPRADWAGNRRL
ncbi:DnaJ C-terminal domain-containing protein [Corynebacterium choanae]|uniref:Chaperone protein DnaJ n=1 Tax=Corynebacterium choanae TaxID=1862358 RepID=A0A3G6J4I1_9CORY|nr:DnaJ C-terminal domain-containing protein [Corynebacterium choanae]AZA12633.1 Chaperone protein DnaJ [Corynebacterium choanae]